MDNYTPYPETQQAVPGNACSNCGFALQPGQDFCPQCGQRAGLAMDPGVSSAIGQFNAQVQASNQKKNWKVPVIIGAVVVVVIALFFLMSGTPVESVSIESADLELRVDETYQLSCEVLPADADDKDVTWKSSNTSVATVSSSGKITARGAGVCTITATADGKSDSISVTVIQMSFEEKQILGTWKLAGYYNGSKYTELPSYGGSFVAYDDFTGKMTVDDTSNQFTWEYLKYGEDMYIFKITLSGGGELAVGVCEFRGEDSVLVSLEEMMIVYQK